MERIFESKNFILKYLVLELFEKLYRLKKYIQTCEQFDRKNNNTTIITLFQNAIEIIGNEVNALCEDIDTDMSDTDKFGYILRISQHSSAIVRIHEELKNLHSTWILPEVKTFTSEIKWDGGDDINIILSDHYSFLESNLGKKFKISLEKAYSKTEYVPAIKDSHSFILPKIEFSNPLNWTILVHEAGHLNENILRELRENPDIMPDDIHTINEQIIKNWAEEIFCDIYAISILGPAYFVSFVTFALLRTMDFGISSHSEMHPSVIIRASIMINYLNDNELVFSRKWGIEDYTSIFYSFLMEQDGIFNDKPKNRIKGLTKFNSNLRRLIKELNLNRFSIKEKDTLRITKLVASLKDGIPIGSVCDSDLEEAIEILKRDNLKKAELDKVKASISQRGTTTWEILNAGWIHKIEVNFRKGTAIFFDLTSDKAIMTKIHEYGEAIDFLDDRLLSSINTAQIIKIIEN